MQYIQPQVPTVCAVSSQEGQPVTPLQQVAT